MDAYSAYIRVSGQGASPVRLVILLYDQLIKDLRRASAKFHDVESRTAELDHALKVLGQLQGTLDLSQGEVADNLDRFYSLLRNNLLAVQSTNSLDLLRQQIDHLLLLREAWVEVEAVAVREELTSRAGQFGAHDNDPASSADWRG